jgi:hypothetical protein
LSEKRLTTQFQIVYTFSFSNVICRQAFDAAKVMDACWFEGYATVEAGARNRILYTALTERGLACELP